VHCGHNGWPGEEALLAVTEAVHAAGFDMPERARFRTMRSVPFSPPQSSTEGYLDEAASV